MSNELIPTKGNALNALAGRLAVNPETLKATLKATAFKECKTDEEFVAAVLVANSYGLNPLTKEIYAFAGKTGGVVPVVSTDGWTRLMVNHQNYKNHHFTYSDKITTMPGAKPCPEWCEIHIEKKDGSITITREYLDEVFRQLTYANPWQTHTKRFLRHKTKIQGARETFGFGGIYDEDEAERIYEAEEASFKGKPEVTMPQEITVKVAVEPQQEPEPEPQSASDKAFNEISGEVLEAQAPQEQPKSMSATDRKRYGYISEAQEKRLYAIAKQHGLNDSEAKAEIWKTFNIEHCYQIPWKKYDAVIEHIKSFGNA